MESMNASEFKAKCFATLDKVHATKRALVILKHGELIAVLGPVAKVTEAISEYPQSKLQGTVKVLGDIVGPVLPEDDWESLAR